MSNWKAFFAVPALVGAVAYMFGASVSASKLDSVQYQFYEKMSEHKLYEVQRFGQCQALMNHMAWEFAGHGQQEEAKAYFELLAKHEKLGILVGAALGFDKDSSSKLMKDGWEWFDLLYPLWDVALEEGYPTLCAQLIEDRTDSLAKAGLYIN